MKEGDSFRFGDFEMRVIDTPGHTLGHITYWMPARRRRLCRRHAVRHRLRPRHRGHAGDDVGVARRSWRRLPDETEIYCGHEYTEANARFALTIEPDNADLVKRAAEVSRLRAAGKPTLPTTIGLEKKTNPFLRVNEPTVRGRLGHAECARGRGLRRDEEAQGQFQVGAGAVSAAGTSPARQARRRRQ